MTLNELKFNEPRSFGVKVILVKSVYLVKYDA